MTNDVKTLLRDARAGNRRAVSRLISKVENGGAEAHAVLRETDSIPAVLRIGITGPPGSGKSTLVGRMAQHFAAEGKRTGIIAVDPSSPFTGGAILGDRIRMDSTMDKDIFFRSMGTRGASGGLSNACEGAARVLAACGFEIILIETVGVGQSEVEIVRMADVVVVVDVPGLGDDIQSIKAGILEIGDLFVVNKCDLPGADRRAHELRAALDSPVLMASAQTGEGVAALCEALIPLAGSGKKKASELKSAAELFPVIETQLLQKWEPVKEFLEERGTKMNCTKIDHIGVAVKSLEEGLKFYGNVLGIRSTETETVEEQKVRVAFLPCGDSEIELLESTDPDGAIARFIEKNGEGVQHIAIRVDDIEIALAELKEKGIRLIDETPRYGAGGARIAFVHPKATNGVLLELCERK